MAPKNCVFKVMSINYDVSINFNNKTQTKLKLKPISHCLYVM